MKRIIGAVLAAVTLAIVMVATVSAQWPETCVNLNDIVENHLGNDGNVGIYQRTFGDQAEQACQNDHRADVQATFGWALGSGPATDTAEEYPRYSWQAWHPDVDPVTGEVTHSVFLRGYQGYSMFFPNMSAGLMLEYSPSKGLVFEAGSSYILSLLNDTFKVEYRIDDGPVNTEYWPAHYSGHQPPELRGARAASFAKKLLKGSEVVIRITGWNKQLLIETPMDTSSAGTNDLRELLKVAGYSSNVPVPQEWPTTCVSLNDIVENHLGNHGNVGIYQKVFGEQAERSCQSDHLTDVQQTFAWAAQ